jgi:hypothetical protein
MDELASGQKQKKPQFKFVRLMISVIPCSVSTIATTTRAPQTAMLEIRTPYFSIADKKRDAAI